MTSYALQVHDGAAKMLLRNMVDTKLKPTNPINTFENYKQAVASDTNHRQMSHISYFLSSNWKK